MAGKRDSRDSRRHSTTSFSENVVVAGARYEMYKEVLSVCYQERAYPPSVLITVLTFSVKRKKLNEAFRGVFSWRTRAKLEVKSPTRPRSRPKI